MDCERSKVPRENILIIVVCNLCSLLTTILWRLYTFCLRSQHFQMNCDRLFVTQTLKIRLIKALKSLHDEYFQQILKVISVFGSSCDCPCTCYRVCLCVCLMPCPKQSPFWDIMVRQTYSTTQIKINKQSQVFTINTVSSLRCVFSMNIQHGPCLSSLDRSCLWEILDSLWK